MKTMKLKRAMLVLTLLVMTLSAVTGGTIAWFTDSVESNVNTISAGNLDIELYLDGTTKVEEDTPVFTMPKLWEPGAVATAKLTLKNEGNLALKYQMTVSANAENDLNGKKLSDVLKIAFVKDLAADATREQTIAAAQAANPTAFAAFKQEGSLAVGATGEAAGTLVVYWLPGANDNDYNVNNGKKTSDGEPLFITLGVNLQAAQLTDEEDSFNNQYDADAKYPPAPGTFEVYNVEDFTAAASAAKAGNTISICADITLPEAEAVTLPAGVVLQGNGKQINGTIYAGGDLTISGHVKVTSFSASYYNRTITIGEGSCLEVTGTGRMTLGYGNVFNITGTLENAKTTDKSTVQPSLIIPGGISITGGNDAAMNVTNAYVKIGSTSSKNNAANGTFTLNFTNSIAEFTNQLTLSEPSQGKNPTFNINIKDSVLTTGTKFVVAAPNSNVVIDNSNVTLASYFRNSGEVTLKNGSVLTGATIQFGESSGNDGTTTVDGSTFTIKATSTGHALDGRDTGKLMLKNGATASVDYYKDMVVEVDATSTFTGTEVD